MANAYDVICQRRSIRRFQQKTIPQDILRHCINAARLAPSGANIQPCSYLIITESKLVKNVFPLLKWAAYIHPKGDPIEGQRPVAYILLLIDLEKKKENGEVDAAAAIQNILLTAWENGIGTCWMKSIQRVKLKKLFEIPDVYKIDSVIAMGFYNEIPKIMDTDQNIQYWKDKNDQLHVPKRKLENISYWNSIKS